LNRTEDSLCQAI